MSQASERAGAAAVQPRARTSRQDSTIHLFVVSNANISNRAIHLGAAFAGSLALVPFATAGLWFAMATGVVFLNVALSRRVDRWPDAPRQVWGVPLLMTATAMNSAMYTLGGVFLWQTGDGVSRLFGVVMLCVSMVYVLMQYYSSPKVFLGVVSPYFAGFAVIIADVAATEAWRAHWLVLLTLAAGALAMGNFLFTARRMLASSRSALREARTLATEREKAAAAASVAKSTFLATMSHEIRTPLNGVLGMAQAMAVDELSGPQRQRLDIVRQSGEALLAILNDILDLSKIEAGKLTLEETEFDLAAVARDAHAAFGAVALASELDFRLEVAPDAQGIYLGDPVRVRQVLSNLISNALKFTHEGAVTVAIEAATPGFRFKVTDTGVGISEEAMGRLFEKFVQADASTTRQFGGTGLGLSICRQITGLMGGEIRAVSEVGVGTTFMVDLPLPRLRDAGRCAEATPLEAGPDAEMAPVRILAAEDNMINELVLKTLLEQVGLCPVIVANGQLAVEAWEQSAWDVILMDVQMPEMDGPTAAKAIREREAISGRARTPIIALTANALAHQVAAYAEAGMDGHVAKPIEAARLFDAIEAALAGETPVAVSVAA